MASLIETLPWNTRLWKSLVSTENQDKKHIESALFFGKKGLGKTQMSVQYAAQFLGSDGVFLGANHPDFHVIMPEEEVVNCLEEGGDSPLSANINSKPHSLLAAYAARYLDDNKNKPKKAITIAQIRRLIEQVVQYPQKASHKVVVIKSADKMNISSSNALLKTLEEPPENTVFVLIADNIEHLPITIRSRCTNFYFRAPDKEIGLQWLQNNGVQDHAESYLMMANKAPLEALRLSESNEIESLRELLTSINDLWRKKVSAVNLATQWKDQELKDTLNHLSRFLIDLLRLQSTNKQDASFELFYPVQKEWSQKIAKSVDTAQLCETIDKIASIIKLADSPADKLLLLEDAAISLEKLAA